MHLQELFSIITDEKRFSEAGDRIFSYRAYRGALMTTWNRDQPLFQLPNQLLDRLADIDVMLDKLHSTHAH